MPSSQLLVNVLYGSVTGNAEEIARNIHTQLKSSRCQQGLLRCLSDFKDIPAFVKPGSTTAYNVIVVSTTGDGDPPETIRPFMRFLRKKPLVKLQGLRYTVLSLGDTNYENFCNTGKRIDNSLCKLGATRFHPRGDADDGVGLEIVVEPWCEGLWSALDKLADQYEPPLVSQIVPVPIQGAEEESVISSEIERAVVDTPTVEQLGFDAAKLPKVFPPKVTAHVVTMPRDYVAPRSVSLSYHTDYVRRAYVSAAQLLTAVDAGKVVWHMEVTGEGKENEPSYCPGDAFGIIVENDAKEVARFLDVIKVDGNVLLRLEKDNGFEIGTASVSQFARQRIDLRAVPKKSLLRVMSDYCEDLEERKALLQLCSRGGRKQYSDEISAKQLSIVDLLEQKARSCRAPFSLFLDQLPGVAPRWYSATSSPELDGASVLQFAFSVVKNGLATNALSKSCEKFLAGEGADAVLIMPRTSDSSSHFRPPASLATSYVMIGPGTGVAPFRGFLRQRSALLNESAEEGKGRTMLFFGCRYEKDFLYREDLLQLEESGVLSVLDVAFSRDGPEKIYVQDRLAERAKEVAEIVREGGSIFVCGDGGGMARSVHLKLGEILGEYCCDGNEEEGKKMLHGLVESHRYVRDIWFHG